MPEHTELAVQFLPILHTLHQIVHTEILVVLGDNLDSFVVEEDEVLDIVQEAFLAEESVYQGLNAQSMFGYLLAVEFLLLVIHAEPLEEELILAVPGTNLGLQAIAQHTDLVESKDVRDVLPIARQVLVVRFFYLDGGVFQFDEDDRQTIHKEEHVGTAIAVMSLDPHLVDAMEVIAVGMVEVDEAHDVEVILAVAAHLYLDAVAYLLVERIVGIYHIRTREVLAKVLEDAFQYILPRLRIEPLQGSEEHTGQDALRWVGTTSSGDLVLRLHPRVTLDALPSILRKRKAVAYCLLYIVFTDK